jgi:hypothetical protein
MSTVIRAPLGSSIGLNFTWGNEESPPDMTGWTLELFDVSPILESEAAVEVELVDETIAKIYIGVKALPDAAIGVEGIGFRLRAIPPVDIDPEFYAVALPRFEVIYQ